MTERHFAFFRQGTGEYIREWNGPVQEPEIDPMLPAEARLVALNAWATDVSEPQYGEIGLDVTQFGYPVGDFCWMRFDEINRLLDWPVSHKFIQIARATMVVDVNSESPRPVRSTPERLVVDITGTSLEPFYGSIFGQLTMRDGRWWLESGEASVPVRTPLALTEAPLDLDLEPIGVKEAVLA